MVINNTNMLFFLSDNILYNQTIKYNLNDISVK